MSTTNSHRSISAAVSPIVWRILAAACVSALAACSGSKSTSTNSDGSPPAPDAAPGSITYWLAPRTSEIDLQLVTTQPTLGF